MLIPEFKKYPKGEYSLIQISPTTDSSELINIGVIVKNLETKEIEFKLFEDISKLSKRVYIENYKSLEYTFEILKKSIINHSDNFEYKNFTNAIKINKPLPISIISASLEEQAIKMFKDKVTLLKTFQQMAIVNNSEYDKRHIIDNINSYLRNKDLENIVKTRKMMPTLLGSAKQVDTIIYNEDNKPIIVSDIISPKTSKIEDLYMKSLFTLKNLSDTSIKEKLFYIPDMDGLTIEVSQKINFIKENIKKENLKINDSKDEKEYIEMLIEESKKVS